MTQIDWITIVLAATSIIVTALGVIIAILAFFGYASIKKASILKAQETALQKLEDIKPEMEVSIMNKIEEKLELLGSSKIDQAKEERITRTLESQGGNDEY